MGVLARLYVRCWGGLASSMLILFLEIDDGGEHLQEILLSHGCYFKDGMLIREVHCYIGSLYLYSLQGYFIHLLRSQFFRIAYTITPLNRCQISTRINRRPSLHHGLSLRCTISSLHWYSLDNNSPPAAPCLSLLLCSLCAIMSDATFFLACCSLCRTGPRWCCSHPHVQRI